MSHFEINWWIYLYKFSLNYCCCYSVHIYFTLCYGKNIESELPIFPKNIVRVYSTHSEITGTERDILWYHNQCIVGPDSSSKRKSYSKFPVFWIENLLTSWLFNINIFWQRFAHKNQTIERYNWKTWSCLAKIINFIFVPHLIACIIERRKKMITKSNISAKNIHLRVHHCGL